MQPTYSGIHIPLITPMHAGKVDWLSLEKLIDFYCAARVHSLMPCGTTGESCTLSHDEHCAVIDFTVKATRGRTRVIPGTGSNSTAEAIALTKFAHEAGANAALVVTPYYNRPTDAGLLDYYTQVCEASPLDVIIYSVASRTGTKVHPSLVARLGNLSSVKGIKLASSDLSEFHELLRTMVGRDFAVLCGEDTLTFEVNALGGHGGVLASAGVLPREYLRLYKHLQDGELDAARALNAELLPLAEGLFIETNPIVVKYAISQLHGIPYELRSPMTSISDSAKVHIDSVLTAVRFIDF